MAGLVAVARWEKVVGAGREEAMRGERMTVIFGGQLSKTVSRRHRRVTAMYNR
jgi:hypothetical protein